MRVDDSYRLLDLEPGASLEEAKRAHRDLTKVWHPDRFGHDDLLRRKAEEKLKTINEAYATIRNSGPAPKQSQAGAWRVRSHHGETRFGDLDAIAREIGRGGLRREAEVLDPGADQWVRLDSMPELRRSFAMARLRRRRQWAFSLGAFGFFVLVRRPGSIGLLIALISFATAWWLMRTREISD